MLTRQQKGDSYEAYAVHYCLFLHVTDCCMWWRRRANLTTEHGTSYTEMILPGEEKSVPAAAGDAATEQDIAKLRSKI